MAADFPLARRGQPNVSLWGNPDRGSRLCGGELVHIAVERGRRERPELELGICGEHRGDPESIRFFDEAGLVYVSCSPFRLPIARVAAAQAAIAAPR